MKTLVLEKPGRLVRCDTPPPGPPLPGQARLRVHRVGICGSDLHAYRGRQPFFSYPRILGHELGVEIAELGDGVTSIRIGDRCAVEPYLNCGRCVACRHGKANCCVSMQVLGVHVDGGMREEIAVPANKLHPSSVLSYDQLALVEALGIGAHAVDRARLDPEESVLVIGAGPIGLAVIQFATVIGAHVILMEVNPRRVDFCGHHFRIEGVLDGTLDPAPALEEMLSGDLPTAVFDATGNPDSMMAAFQCVASGGRLIFVGLCQHDITFWDPEFHRREVTLLASRNALGTNFSRIIQLVEAGEVDASPWITHRASFEDGVEQFPGWLEADAGVLKAMLSL